MQFFNQGSDLRGMTLIAVKDDRDQSVDEEKESELNPDQPIQGAERDGGISMMTIPKDHHDEGEKKKGPGEGDADEP